MLWGNLESDLTESLILGKLKQSKDVHFQHENMVQGIYVRNLYKV